MKKKFTGIFETTATKVTGTSDGRGTKCYWTCPNCGYKKNSPTDSIFFQPIYGKTCDSCSEYIKIINNTYPTKGE